MTLRWRIPVLVLAFLSLGVFLLGLKHLRDGQPLLLEQRTPSIMGTETTLKVVVRAGDTALGHSALARAEAVLRETEARISTWIGTSELARLNNAGVGDPVPLSPDTIALLDQARELTRATGGAFDPTCRPLLELWSRAESEDQLPTPAAITEARTHTGWQQIEIGAGTASRLTPGVTLDLGGMGKGWAVDAALDVIQASGALGGMVQCGGDLKAFGLNPDRQPWTIGIRNPFASAGVLRPEALHATQLAVSTSGNYERTFRIGGKRYSHIIDPRTGQPVDHVPQVTVLAPTSWQADGWATALSVLGPTALDRLPDGLEAMILSGAPLEPRVDKTPNFDRWLTPPVTVP